MTLTSLSFLPGENERIELVNSQGPFDPSWSRPQLGSLCCWAPPHVFLPSSPSARSEHLILPRIFTCCFYMQRGTEKPPKHLSLPAIPDPALESLGQRGCLLCLRSLQRTAGEPSVSASHPRGSPLRVLGVVAVESFFCVVGYSAESQVSTPWMSVAPLTPLVTT